MSSEQKRSQTECGAQKLQVQRSRALVFRQLGRMQLLLTLRDPIAMQRRIRIANDIHVQRKQGDDATNVRERNTSTL